MTNKYILKTNQVLNNNRKGIKQGRPWFVGGNQLHKNKTLSLKGGLVNIHKQIDDDTPAILDLGRTDDDGNNYSDLNISIPKDEIFSKSMETWLEENYHMKLQDISKHKDLYQQFLKAYNDKINGKTIKTKSLFKILNEYFPYDYPYNAGDT